MYNSNKSAVDITVVSSQPTIPSGSARCDDNYMILSTAAVKWFNTITATKTQKTVTTSLSLSLPEDTTEAEFWDMDEKGVRIMRYLKPKAETISNIIVTLETFVPEELPNVPEKYAQMGVDFMGKYAGFKITPRDPSLNIAPDESEIQSGDVFYLMRFDGLNPLLAWAMGSTTGHVTTALWIDGELYVCESTIDSAYWPQDHIQKTPYRTWINQTIAADFQVVFAKLSDEARKSFNETAAVEFFKANEGFDYGFSTMIWAWLDTERQNFPCLPPDFSSNCMQWELLEPFIAHIDRVIPQIGYKIWNPGFAKRLGLSDQLRTSQLYYEASKQGMTSSHVITIPEQDTWMYNTTRWDEPAVGRSMVCCVFVCSTWKAAGVFGELADSINCAEVTNWDDYALTIHGGDYRQIVGTYSLELNNYKTKTPYAHMAEKCPSMPLEYAKPADC